MLIFPKVTEIAQAFVLGYRIEEIMLLRGVETSCVGFLSPCYGHCRQPTNFQHVKLSSKATNLRNVRYTFRNRHIIIVRAVGEEERINQWKAKASGSVQELFGEKLFRGIAGVTASPIAQYISSPRTFIHFLDPRVKQAWLLALVVLPARSPSAVQLGLVVFLALLTICSLPHEISKDQLLRTSFLSAVLFIILAFTSDVSPPVVQSRTPSPQALQLPCLQKSLKGYSYVALKFGPFQLTRKSLGLATTTSCLSFMLLQSTSLCLATTTPEQLAAALRWYLLPMAYVGVPVDEIILSLLLSLRFISLVFDEVRSIALGIVARGIQWKNLTLLETIDIFGSYLRRIFHNLSKHAEQISQAMIARGFRGNASLHKIYLLARLSIQKADILAVVSLFGLMSVSVLYEFFNV